jgi:hypothetical protein
VVHVNGGAVVHVARRAVHASVGRAAIRGGGQHDDGDDRDQSVPGRDTDREDRDAHAECDVQPAGGAATVVAFAGAGPTTTRRTVRRDPRDGALPTR